MKKLDKIQHINLIPLKNTLLVIKVGSDERPASSECLEQIRSKFQEALGNLEGLGCL